MPKVNVELPDHVKPYKFHGLVLNKDTKGNWISDCPFCDGNDKFSIKGDNGVARCWTCGVGSGDGGLNILTFLRTLYERSRELTKPKDYNDISVNFGLLFKETPREWGMAKSLITDRWIVPGYSADGRVMTLYHLTRIRGKDKKYKHVWLPTPVQGHHLCFESKSKFKSRIYACEGLKDAMAWWEILSHSEETEDGHLIPTNSRSNAIIKGSTVIAVTGVNVFKEEYLKMFNKKEVVLLFDSDHPRTVKGREIEPPGLEGVKRFSTKLMTGKYKPSSIKWLDWGGTGLGYDPALPSGTDIRDFLSKDKLND